MKLEMHGNGNEVTLKVGKLTFRALVDFQETLLMPERFHATLTPVADTDVLTCYLSVNDGFATRIGDVILDRAALLDSVRESLPLPLPLLDMLLSKLAKVE